MKNRREDLEDNAVRSMLDSLRVHRDTHRVGNVNVVCMFVRVKKRNSKNHSFPDTHNTLSTLSLGLSHFLLCSSVGRKNGGRLGKRAGTIAQGQPGGTRQGGGRG